MLNINVHSIDIQIYIYMKIYLLCNFKLFLFAVHKGEKLTFL